MQKLGDNKAVMAGESKGSVKIKYIGYKAAVYVAEGLSWPKTTFERDKAVEVGPALAAMLLNQPEKFKAVS